MNQHPDLLPNSDDQDNQYRDDQTSYNPLEDEVIADFTDTLLRSHSSPDDKKAILPPADVRDEQARLKRIVSALDDMLNQAPAQPKDTFVFTLKRKLDAEFDIQIQQRSSTRTTWLRLGALAAIILVGFVIVLSGALGVNPADTVGTAVGNLNGDMALAGVMLIAVVTLIVYVVSRRRQ